MDDDFLDPLRFPLRIRFSLAGHGGYAVSARSAWRTHSAPGVADDKAIYAYVPNIIRYYLGEDPILPNVPTYLPTEPDDYKYVLDHLRGWS